MRQEPGGRTRGDFAREQRRREQRRVYQRRWYARHKAAQTEVYQRHWEENRAASAGLTLAQYRARPRVQLVCCDLWQAVTTLPHVCTQCGRRYLEPAGEGR